MRQVSKIFPWFSDEPMLEIYKWCGIHNHRSPMVTHNSSGLVLCIPFYFGCIVATKLLIRGDRSHGHCGFHSDLSASWGLTSRFWTWIFWWSTWRSQKRWRIYQELGASIDQVLVFGWLIHLRIFSVHRNVEDFTERTRGSNWNPTKQSWDPTSSFKGFWDDRSKKKTEKNWVNGEHE
jgi:hypothetical protein